MDTYKFDCGCEFEILDPKIKKSDGLPSLKIDYSKVPLDCPRTYQIFHDGYTKGVWQLEKQLGKHWSKRIKPDTIEHISAIISLIRPGCLNCFIDKKSVPDHYADRKNNGEEIKYLHPALEPILANNFGLMLYQEDSLFIARDIAGFDLKTADMLRKAIGKKDTELMAKVRKDFLEGCAKTGIVNEEIAVQLFDWIKESQRYSFNLAHGIGYGSLGYLTAYAKAHFPQHFYTAYLRFAKERPETETEVRELVNEGRLIDLKFKAPSILDLQNEHRSDFHLDSEGIHFGIRNIKKIGDNHIKDLIAKIAAAQVLHNKKIAEWNWSEFVLWLGINLSKTVVNGIIAAGALDHIGLSRQRMLFEYDKFSSLNDKEIDWLRQPGNGDGSLMEMVARLNLHFVKHKRRKITVESIIKSLQECPYSTNDDINWIVDKERSLLGTPINYSKTIMSDVDTNCTCINYALGQEDKPIIAGEILNIRVVLCKNGQSAGKEMCFFDLEDETGIVSCVCFPSNYEQYIRELYNSNTVVVYGSRGQKDSMIVNKLVEC